MKILLAFLFAAFFISSCSKESYTSESTETRIRRFLISKPGFHIKDMKIGTVSRYEEDTKIWLKDDIYIFTSPTDVEIHQNAIKIPGNQNEILYLKWGIYTTGNGVKITFYDEFYRAAEYDVEGFNPNTNTFVASMKDGRRQIQTIYESIK